MARTVDVHAHLVPPRVLDAIHADGSAHGFTVVAGAGGVPRVVTGGSSRSRSLDPFFLDVDGRIEWLDRYGVEVQAIAPVASLVDYRARPEDAAWLARIFNVELAEMASRHPDRLVGVASVPLQDAALAAAELEYAVQTLGLRAVQIATNVRGRHLDGPELDPFWAKAQELEILVILHPAAVSAAEPLKDYHLGTVLAFPFDTAVAAASLICGGVLERFPRLDVCLPHAGGLLPYQITRVDRAYEVGLIPQTLPQPPSAYLERFYFDAVLDDPSALKLLIEKVGPDRLLLGTDCPFEMAIDAVKTVERIPDLTTRQRESILGGVATRLLRLTT
ncbi:MAG: amidohydrolase [Armatimonadetes bacterium]|nr:amidohydrolase [Armatimonadota bacterium]